MVIEKEFFHFGAKDKHTEKFNLTVTQAYYDHFSKLYGPNCGWDEKRVKVHLYPKFDEKEN